jgi:hypothetical protein
MRHSAVFHESTHRRLCNPSRFCADLDWTCYPESADSFTRHLGSASSEYPYLIQTGIILRTAATVLARSAAVAKCQHAG